MDLEKAKTIIAEAAARQMIVLANAAELASKKIATATEDAAKVIASSAAEAVRISTSKNMDGMNDHDLLVELKTKITAMDKSIQSLSDLLNIKTSDHEARLRANEKDIERLKTQLKIGGAVIVFIVTAIQFILSHYWK